ncbi:MAG TPA: nuclear transport factor 2 family protein, partial [Gemmataceae bacterium]
MKRWMPGVLAAVLLAAVSLGADEVKTEPKEDPAHNELRALRDGVIDAFNKNDIDRLLTYVHKDCVLTWQDGEVSRGHEGIREYYRKMMTGDQRVVRDVKATAEVDRLTTLFGDKDGLASGSL